MGTHQSFSTFVGSGLQLWVTAADVRETMARGRRIIRPGKLIHIIVRFLNREFVLRDTVDRAEYLRRVGLTFGASDWRVLSYALMSTHTHFGAIAGTAPFGGLSKALHAGFVGWLNPRRGRLGPLVASRPATHEIAFAGAARLIAYHHNNPVRANVVTSASDSTWTSHQAYVGERSGPEWLDVDAGLELAGFGSSRAGRAAFAQFVDTTPSDATYAIDDAAFAELRCDIRRRTDSTVELEAPAISSDSQHYEVGLRSLAPIQSVQDLGEALEFITEQQQCPLAALRSPSRRRAIVRVRRLAILALHEVLGLPLNRVAANVGITSQAAHQLALSATDSDRDTARRLAMALQRGCKT